MSNLFMLPIYQANIGVGVDENFNFSVAFTLSDGVTPLDITGIGWGVRIVNIAFGINTLITTNEPWITTSGSPLHIVTLNYIPGEKQSWPVGTYQFELLAQSGFDVKDVFQTPGSTLVIGPASPLALTLVAPPGSNIQTMATAVSSALAGDVAAIATNTANITTNTASIATQAT